LAELAKARAEEEARLKKEEEERRKANAERLAEDFKKLIAQGDRELGSKAFEVALTSYRMALDLHVDDNLANQKISEAEKAKSEYESKLAAEEEKRRKEEEEARMKREAAQRKLDFEKKIKEGDQAMLARLFDAAVESYQAALDLHIDDALAGKKLDEATKKRDEADRKKREKEEEIARMAEEARKKKEELERKRLEEESKRKGIDDDLARKRAEAEERERLYREKMRLENEKRQEEIRKKIEAQKQALAMADKFRLQREQQVRDAQKQTGSSENLSRFELADKYPQGVTQEEIDGPNCVITRVVIVNGKVGDEYRKIKYNWGQTAYKKNDKDISEAMFKKETGR
jgi:hypothetical protein